MIQTKIYSAMTLITPQGGSTDPVLNTYSICRNEQFSFQMGYKWVDTPNEEKSHEELHFNLRIVSDLPVSLYHVACVPVMHKYTLIEDDYPIGMYPDILLPKQTNPTLLRQTTAGEPGYRFVEKGEQLSLAAYHDSWRQVWLTVNENGALSTVLIE